MSYKGTRLPRKPSHVKDGVQQDIGTAVREHLVGKRVHGCLGLWEAQGVRLQPERAIHVSQN